MRYARTRSARKGIAKAKHKTAKKMASGNLEGSGNPKEPLINYTMPLQVLKRPATKRASQ